MDDFVFVTLVTLKRSFRVFVYISHFLPQFAPVWPDKLMQKFENCLQVFPIVNSIANNYFE